MSFMLEEKTIQFANFNITFGENEEAMLNCTLQNGHS